LVQILSEERRLKRKKNEVQAPINWTGSASLEREGDTEGSFADGCLGLACGNNDET